MRSGITVFGREILSNKRNLNVCKMDESVEYRKGNARTVTVAPKEDTLTANGGMEANLFYYVNAKTLQPGLSGFGAASTFISAALADLKGRNQVGGSRK